MKFQSTKVIELGSCCFRQPEAKSHCHYLHGYNLTAKFWFQAKTLNETNWVVDFGGLKEIKNILRNTFDHKTVVGKKEPRMNVFKLMEEEELIDLVVLDRVGAEYFAMYCMDQMNEWLEKQKFSNNPRCIKVEVYEHSRNSAIISQ